jgi:hypothetical protein
MPKNKKPAGGRPAKNFEPRFGAKKSGGPSAGSRSPGHRGFRAESTEAAHLPASVQLTVTAHLAVTVMNVPPTTGVSVLSVLVTSVQNVLRMAIVLLVETVLLSVTAMNVLPTTGASVPNVPVTTATIVLPMVTALSVLALTAMLLAANVPATVTVTNVPHTTGASVLSVRRMVTALSVLVTSVLNVLRMVIVLLVETVLPTVTATTVPHVTLAETVPVTTRTKHLVVPLQTSTLQRTRRLASLLKKMSYSSVLKLRQPLLLMLMA